MPANVSSDVTPGTDATATEFNNLRTDVLRHGQADVCNVTFLGNISIPNSTEMTVDFDYYELIDNNAMHDNSVNPSRINIKNDGIYRISFYLLVDPSSGWVAYIKKNTTSYIQQFKSVDNPAGGYDILRGEIIHSLSAGDYVEITVAHYSGGSLNITGSSPLQHGYATFSVEQIAGA